MRGHLAPLHVEVAVVEWREPKGHKQTPLRLLCIVKLCWKGGEHDVIENAIRLKGLLQDASALRHFWRQGPIETFLEKVKGISNNACFGMSEAAATSVGPRRSSSNCNPVC